jgi:hypothetical protein
MIQGGADLPRVGYTPFTNKNGAPQGAVVTSG